MKPFQAVGGHELRVGPDARAEQAFVRVNIPAPRQHGLIKEQRLDLAPPPGKQAAKASASISSGSGPRLFQNGQQETEEGDRTRT